MASIESVVERRVSVSVRGVPPLIRIQMLDRVFRVVQQDLDEAEGIGQIALADEVVGAGDGGAALPDVVGAGQLVEDIARFGELEQVGSDHERGAEIAQIPGVDPVVAAHAEIVELRAASFGRLLAAGPLVHGADAADPDPVHRTLQQSLALRGRQVDELLGEGEDLAHGHAQELVALAVFAGTGRHVACVLFPLGVGLKRGEASHEPRGRHERSFISCTVHPLPSGSWKKRNEFMGPPGPSTRDAPSKCWTGLTVTPRPTNWERAAPMSATTNCSPSNEPGVIVAIPVPITIEHPDPGGVSWLNRIPSLIRVS